MKQTVNDLSDNPLWCPAPSVPPQVPREPFFAQITIQEDFGRVVSSPTNPFGIAFPPSFNCIVNSSCDNPCVDPRVAKTLIDFIRYRLDEWEKNLDWSLDKIWETANHKDQK